MVLKFHSFDDRNILTFPFFISILLIFSFYLKFLSLSIYFSLYLFYFSLSYLFLSLSMYFSLYQSISLFINLFLSYFFSIQYPSIFSFYLYLIYSSFYLIYLIYLLPTVGENIIATTKIRKNYCAIQSLIFSFLYCSL